MRTMNKIVALSLVLAMALSMMASAAVFTATLPIFKNYTQYDMIEYFKNHQAIGINFKIGYGFNQNRPALMLAIPPENRKIIFEKHMKTNTKKISIKTQEVKKHNANNLNILKMIKIK